MTDHNPANERIKRQYFAYLDEAQGYSEQSVDAVAKAIARLKSTPAIRTSRRSILSKPGPSSGTFQNSVAEAVSR